MSLQDVCDNFDNIIDDQNWRLRGVSPEEVYQFCVFHGCPMFFYAGGQVRLSSMFTCLL